LIVERLSPAHFDEIGRLHRDPEVMKTLSADGNILADEVTREGLRQADEPWERHGFGLWAFRGKADGRFIGRGGLTRDTIDGESEVGLASAVLSRAWGRGDATEMVEASLGVGFARLRLPAVATWTLPTNRSSSASWRSSAFGMSGTSCSPGCRTGITGSPPPSGAGIEGDSPRAC
jgi:ribosomal-protein-alanine N-acetyltransferase